MDELPFRLKNWNYRDLLEELEQIPSDQESILDEDSENEELTLPEQTLQDEVLISDESDAPTDDDDAEDDIPLSIIRQQIIKDQPDV